MIPLIALEGVDYPYFYFVYNKLYKSLSLSFGSRKPMNLEKKTGAGFELLM